MNVTTLHQVHLIGIGGINMSAVAKLLLANKIRVSGSDAVENEATKELRDRGVNIKIGADANHIPANTDLVIYSSAVPKNHIEREAARARNIKEQTNFEFLGEWTKDKRTILVTGTHGKSTTTSMLGNILIQGDLDPTVIVGSRVPGFPDQNLRLGKSDLYLIEGDEYAKHFLEFTPDTITINNIELDHTDIFKDLTDMVDTFRQLLRQMKPNGLVIANADDKNVMQLIQEEQTTLLEKGIAIQTFGYTNADQQISSVHIQTGRQNFSLSMSDEPFTLTVPGKINILNASAAATMASAFGVSQQNIRTALQNFTGIWRRFERIAEKDGTLIISDYGHHPTAVRETLQAAKDFYPDKRLVLCFQPHHRNRTKELFSEFVTSFDLADIVLLCEIYDVKGRDAGKDQDMSSRLLVEAVQARDATTGNKHLVEFTTNPAESLKRLKELVQPNDLVLVMSAGDLYQIAPQILL